MELLTRTWRDLWRRLQPDVLFSTGILAALLTIEIIGRRHATTDVHDLCALIMLAGIGYLIVQRHRVTPLGWVNALGQLLRRAADWVHQRYAMEVGFDLRGRPPLPAALPRPLIAGLTLIVAIVIFGLLFAAYLPLDVRGLAVHTWYLGYLGLLTLMWAALLGGTCMAFGYPFALIHDAFVAHAVNRSQRAARAEGMALVGYFAFFMMAAFYLPAWVPLIICLLALAVNVATIVIPSNTDVKIIWRYRQPVETLHAIPWGWWVTWEFTFLAMAAIALALLSAGSSVMGFTPTAAEAAAASAQAAGPTMRPPLPHEAMPITTSLGLTLAWLAAGALSLRVGQSVVVRLRDPARPCRPVLHITGTASPQDRRAIDRHFRANGWQVHWAPRPSEATDVCVVLAEDQSGEDSEASSWPLRVSTEALLSEAIEKRLARRSEIQLRRRLVAGLEKLFKQAASRKYRRGTGMWLAPHLWFIPGVSRDTREDELDLEQGTLLSGMIGQPYHRVFPRCVRNHLYLILRALHIDLIFVEDGVSYRKFARVLRMMFELYDVHGGRRKAQEVHFQGLPGVRVLIHDYVLDEPFKSESYPEPEFESLGRARILHVFKDRGEQEEPLETPLDWTNMPAPCAAL
jgi:hypothetical protein